MIVTAARSSTADSDVSLSGYARVALAVCLVHLAIGGAVGGVIMLLRIIGTETALSIPRVWVEAHANSQIVGVLALAIVGVTCSVLPRIKRTLLSGEGWISLAASGLVVGSVMHALCHSLQETIWPDRMLLGSLTASFVQLISWAYFLIVLLAFLRKVPRERQKRFEKCVLIGAVWFGVAMTMVIFVRVMFLAKVWVVAIDPKINFSLRYLQLMTGMFLMVAGLAQPVYRGWPKDAAWRPRLIPQLTLWGVIVAAFFICVASPWAGVVEPRWVPSFLTAGAVFNVLAVGAYAVSLSGLTRRVRKWDAEAISPWRGAWIGPNAWLIASTAGTAALILLMAWLGEFPARGPLFHVAIHAFVLGFVFPLIVLVCRHFDLLWRWGSIGPGLAFLNIGLALFVIGYPWMMLAPNVLARSMVLIGGGLQGAAIFLLSLTGLADLFIGNIVD